MTELVRVEKQNLSQKVYARIRDALMNGQYQPGDRLRISELAASLGTSITPVREAVFRLASEQALEIIAATSVFVPKLDMATVHEIQLMRSLLEGAAAAEAAKRITPEEVDALAVIQECFIKASSTDARDAAKRNRDFHFGLLNAAHLPSLSAVVETLWVRMGPLLNTFHATVPSQSIYVDSHPHYKVLEGLRKGDADMAAAAIREDIQWGERVFMAWMSGRSVANVRA